jgi:hypothetical protein
VAYFAATGASVGRLRVTVAGISLADVFFASLVYYVVRHSGEAKPLLRAFA